MKHKGRIGNLLTISPYQTLVNAIVTIRYYLCVINNRVEYFTKSKGLRTYLKTTRFQFVKKRFIVVILTNHNLLIFRHFKIKSKNRLQ